MTIDIQSHINIARSFILTNLLPDTCTVYATTYAETSTGGYTLTPGSNKQYNSSANIPCRLDPTRQYRDVIILQEEVTSTDYTLNLPYDFNIAVDDIVVHNGLKYVVKKLTDDNSWKAVKRANVTIVR